MKRRAKGSSSLSLERLRTDPTLCLHHIDPVSRVARFVDLPLVALGPPRVCVEDAQATVEIELDELSYHTELSARPSRVAHYIFMTEYCGSTLLSQALGWINGLFAYGERYPLASMAAARLGLLGAVPSAAEFGELLGLTLRYQAKTPRPAQAALLKEWSVTNVLIPDILRADRRSRAIFLYSGLEQFLISVLKSERRRALARQRMQQVFKDVSELLPLREVRSLELADHEIGALQWLYQMYLFSERGYAREAQLRSVHCELLWRDPQAVIHAVCEHFGLNPSHDDFNAIVNGPIFATHAKSGRPYSPGDHLATLGSDRVRFSRELDAGTRYADDLMRKYPLPAQLPSPLLT